MRCTRSWILRKGVDPFLVAAELLGFSYCLNEVLGKEKEEGWEITVVVEMPSGVRHIAHKLFEDVRHYLEKNNYV